MNGSYQKFMTAWVAKKNYKQKTGLQSQIIWWPLIVEILNKNNKFFIIFKITNVLNFQPLNVNRKTKI